MSVARTRGTPLFEAPQTSGALAPPEVAVVANGAKNKLLPEDAPVHDWYRFVLSFPPTLVRQYVRRFQVGEGDRVLDPFCGTGTTLVECKKLGVPSWGFEAHPMAAFASRVKTDWAVDPAALSRFAMGLAGALRARLAKKPRRLRTLPAEAQRLLLKDCISPLPLHKTLVLLDYLQGHGDKPFQPVLLLALASALVRDISNLHFGPEVGVRGRKDDVDVLSAWARRVRDMAADVAQVRSRARIPTRVWCHDSREMLVLLPERSVSAVITSPPYPNEKDYTRTMRLETVLLGFARNRRELRRLKQGLLRSNTRNVYRGDEDHKWVAPFPEIRRIAEQIEERRIAMGKTSGFERQYARVTLLYFGGMARHLSGLRRALRPGARLAYVVGDQASYLRVPIRTGQLLATIAESLGYQVEGLELFRTRLATATREQLREEVLVLHWPGE